MPAARFAVCLLALGAGLAPCPAHGAQAGLEHGAAAAPVPGPVRDLGGAVAALGRDFWMTFSAPARMGRQEWLVTAGVVSAGGLLFLLDDEITAFALRNLDAPVLGQIHDVGTFLEPLGLMGNTNAWYASGAVLSYAVGLDRPKRIFTELLYSHWIAGLIRNGTKKLVGRARPHDDRGSRHFALGEGTSFPSGHASTIIQIAAVLSHHADLTAARVALYGLAGTVAWQRITSEQHWASDVWLGAAYGWAVAKLVVRLHEADALRLEPVPGPDGGLGLAVRIAF